MPRRLERSNSPPTYIITGGAGFVGSNLCAALAARTPGARLIVIDDFRTGSFANIVEAFSRRGLPAFSGEIIGKPFWEYPWDAALGSLEVDAVFHEGAITDTTVLDEPLMMLVNSEKSEIVMRACARHGVPLVYASSAATYGSPREARDRVPFPITAAGSPNNVYGFSKWMMECVHRRISAESGGAPPWIVGLRYFNVFGPGESRKGKMASMVYQLGQQLLAGKTPRIFADGSQARDQVYVEDVVECTMAGAGLGAKKAPTPGVYNVGSGVTTSFNQMIEALRQGLAIPPGKQATEYFEMPASIRAFYQDYTCADLSETGRGLGWTPRWKPADAIGAYAKVMASEHRPG